ncbi:MAG: carbamoyltransferase HypF [Gammaproteobacteria bacterium]
MLDSHAPQGLAIRVRGTVQGVGFRPAVWRLARDCGLRGAVWNDGGGVGIEAWGTAPVLAQFLRRLTVEAPPLARIDTLESEPLAPATVPEDFVIRASAGGAVHIAVAPDAATCPACLAEIRDPGARRHRYAFTNCTQCGPRLSIVRAIPYDRARTSMAPFIMCPACRAEYENPGDRRFHAQPIACASCGPRLWLENREGAPLAGDPLENACRLLAAGHILAIKGIGGIHLACDGGNQAAVARLRRRKVREHKPFALMARDLAMVRRYAVVDEVAGALLESPAAPVVVMAAQPDHGLAAAVAPEQDTLGFMLPYTPLHHLLLAGLARPVVLTSGNPSGRPQCIANDEARRQLAGVADYWLLHDREIVNRLDDSVLRPMAGRPRMLRRARGYAPEPLSLPAAFAAAPPLLALGGELKNAFCLLQDGQALVSQHMGDLEEAAVHEELRYNLRLYRDLFKHKPAVIAVDRHPRYFSTQLGQVLAAEMGIPLLAVQHHHAHVAAVMAEQGLASDAQVLGIVLDGLGYGADESLWGGEFLLAGYRDFRRLASFQPVPLPGGARAVLEPWRNAYAHLFPRWQVLRERFAGLPALEGLAERPLVTLSRMLQRRFNSPPASSAGRLFDAAAALLDIHAGEVAYEGQAAMVLETLAAREFAACAGQAYPWESASGNDGLRQLRWLPMWEALLTDLAAGEERARIAARFHHTVAQAVAATALDLAGEVGVEQIVLSGGVFQNRLLLESVDESLRRAGLQVLIPERYPLNDGGLALGQAVVAALKVMRNA